MADRPIIFSGPMVRALLAGRKTQTRRLATSPLRRCEVGDRLWVRESARATELEDGRDGVGYEADMVWHPIESSFEAAERWLTMHWYGRDGSDASRPAGKLVPSIHMPRWASRLTLIVEGVKIEPLQAISEADAIAEGCKAEPFPSPWWQGYREESDGYLLHQEAVGEEPPIWMIEPHPMRPVKNLDRSAADAYRLIWNSLHSELGERWEDDPQVVALTFRVERANIDRLGSEAA